MYTFYQILWMFLIYALLGWCMEVIFQATRHGRFINRGFLNGPVCPIYGFGVVLVVTVLTPLSQHLGVLFLGGVLLTSALEFLTGFILEKIFNDKWWDYSHEPFNLKGYICLRFSLAWGIACVIVMDRIQPLVLRFINWLPSRLGTILLIIFWTILVVDMAVTLYTALKLRRRLRSLEDIGHILRNVSDRMGEPMANRAINLQEKLPKAKQRLKKHFPQATETSAALREKYQTLITESNSLERRLLRAFPRLQRGKYRESIDRLRQEWQAKREASRRH